MQYLSERLIDIKRDFQFNTFKQDEYQKAENEAFDSLNSVISSSSEVKISFFGKRYISSIEFKKNATLEEVYLTLIEVVKLSRFDFSNRNRKIGLKIENKIHALYNESDKKIQNSFFIKRIFAWIRDVFSSLKKAYKGDKNLLLFNHYSYNQYQNNFSKKNLPEPIWSFNHSRNVMIPLYSAPNQHKIVKATNAMIRAYIYPFNKAINALAAIATVGSPLCLALVTPFAIRRSYLHQESFDAAYSSVLLSVVNTVSTFFAKGSNYIS